MRFKQSLCAFILAIYLCISGCDLFEDFPYSNKENFDHELANIDINTTTIKDLKGLVYQNPDHAYLRYLLGNKYLLLENAVAAHSSYIKAKNLGFKENDIDIAIAETLLIQKKYQLALDSINEFLKKDSINIYQELHALLINGYSQLHIQNLNKNEILDNFIKIYRILKNSNLVIDDSKYINLISLKNNISRLGHERNKYEVIEQAAQHADCSNREKKSTEFVENYFDIKKIGYGNKIKVGPKQKIKSIYNASLIAKNGDIIEIDSGIYSGDIARWKQNDLIIKGLNGYVNINANGKISNDKGIWVIEGDNVLIEDILFSNAKSKFRNGAGIRASGKNLYIKNCRFFNNEMGILSSHETKSNIIIEGSEFKSNKVNYQKYGALGHNIYIGRINTFILINSYSHDAEFGHLLKSRAKNNIIIANFITDHNDGKSSYNIDIPEGGNTFIFGNIISQSAFSENASMIAYAAEKKSYPENNLIVLNNNFINFHVKGINVYNHINISNTIVSNNIFSGVPSIKLKGNGQFENNHVETSSKFISPEGNNFETTYNDNIIDKGIEIDNELNPNNFPLYEYHHPLMKTLRKSIWKMDIGAYEYCIN